MKTKRFFCCLLAALMAFVCLPSGALAAAGTAEDPLVTVSYVKGTVLPAVQTTISQTFSSYKPGSVVSLPAGTTVSLSEGQYFILVSGNARISSLSGTMVNATVGYAASTGGANRFHRYICCEGSSAVLTIKSNASLYVSGGAGVSAASGAVTFTDVASDAWYHDWVQKAYDQKLMVGVSSTTFNPNGNITVQQIAQILYSMSGEKVTVADSSPWYAAAVQWAKANGIYTGSDEGGQDAGRTDIVEMFYRYASYRGKNMSAGSFDLSTVTDADAIPDADRAAFAWAFSSGIIAGTSTSSLTASPSSLTSRAQMATIAVTFTSKFGK